MTGVSTPPVPASLSGVASRRRTAAGALDTPVKIDVDGLNFYYGEKRALDGISIQIRANLVTAFIGPSGCGKSTFLRTLNRMNDIIPATRVEGTVLIDGKSIYDSGRRRRRSCGAGSAWCSRSRTRSRSRSSRTSPTACASTA